MLKQPKKIIGWREFIDLPLLKAKQIKVKVDTGAATSALHAEDIFVISHGGHTKVRFTLYPNQKNKNKKVVTEAPFVEYRHIRSSTGHVTERPVIRTHIKIGDEEPFEIDITLVNRDIMGFRMLLGRRGIKKKFFVNPGKSFLLSHKPAEKKKSKKKSVK